VKDRKCFKRWLYLVALPCLASSCQSLDDPTETSLINPYYVYDIDQKNPTSKEDDSQPSVRPADLPSYTYSQARTRTGKISKTRVVISPLSAAKESKSGTSDSNEESEP
jgi:hypothetical protein